MSLILYINYQENNIPYTCWYIYYLTEAIVTVNRETLLNELKNVNENVLGVMSICLKGNRIRTGEVISDFREICCDGVQLCV